MKSFTRNPTSNPVSRTDARFDALMKQQMLEHQSVIGSHHKEMQTLRDNLSISMERCQSLSDKNVYDLKEFKSQALHELTVLAEKILSHTATNDQQWETIESIHDQFQSFPDNYVSKKDLNTLVKSLEARIQDSTNNYLSSFQDLQRELKILIFSIKEDVEKLKSDMDAKLLALREKGENNFSFARLEKDGVLSELRVYKLDMFVIEKKIENIYTLIERINKRGNVLP